MTTTIRQRGKNKTWSAQVIRTIRGERITKCATFPTKPAAREWAAGIEAELYAMKTGRAAPGQTFDDLLTKYLQEIDAQGETRSAERSAIRQCRGNKAKGIKPDALLSVPLAALDQSDFVAFRNRQVARGLEASSVRRLMATWASVCTLAVDEWKLMSTHPMKKVRWSIAESNKRDRRVSAAELDAVKLASGYRPNVRPESAQARATAAFLFACETGMRLGEVCGLVPADCHVKAGWVQVSGTAPRASKTKATRREVPLTKEAGRILQQMLDAGLGAQVFGIKPSVASTMWARVTKLAKVANLHFHDSRHEAISRLAQEFDALALAKFVGISDLNTLLGVYYNPSIDDLVARIRKAA